MDSATYAAPRRSHRYSLAARKSGARTWRVSRRVAKTLRGREARREGGRQGRPKEAVAGSGGGRGRETREDALLGELVGDGDAGLAEFGRVRAQDVVGDPELEPAVGDLNLDALG